MFVLMPKSQDMILILPPISVSLFRLNWKLIRPANSTWNFHIVQRSRKIAMEFGLLTQAGFFPKSVQSFENSLIHGLNVTPPSRIGNLLLVDVYFVANLSQRHRQLPVVILLFLCHFVWTPDLTSAGPYLCLQ